MMPSIHRQYGHVSHSTPFAPPPVTRWLEGTFLLVSICLNTVRHAQPFVSLILKSSFCILVFACWKPNPQQ